MQYSHQHVSSIPCSTELLTINHSDTMEAASRLMETMSIRHLAVVDDDGAIVGMISDRDTAKTNLEQADWLTAIAPHPEYAPHAIVRECMSWPVVTIDENLPIKEAARLMLENKTSALVVLKDEKAIGIVSTEDLLTTIVKADDDASTHFQMSIAAAIYESPLGPIAQTLANAGV